MFWLRLYMRISLYFLSIFPLKKTIHLVPVKLFQIFCELQGCALCVYDPAASFSLLSWSCICLHVKSCTTCSLHIIHPSERSKNLLMITDYTSFLIGTNTEAVQRAVINDAISSEVKLLQFDEGRELFNLLISSITSIMCQIHWIYVPPTEPTTLFLFVKSNWNTKFKPFFAVLSNVLSLRE